MSIHAQSESADGARPIDALLAGYVAGTLEPHLHALIGSHLMLSDKNRGFVRALEAEAGAALEEIDAPKPPRAARDHILSAIYAGGYYGRGAPVRRDPEVPEPLYRLINHGLDDLPWKMKAPGLREHVLRDSDGIEASFFKIKAGQAMPIHTHEGSEVTLVLRGAFSDARGRYERGDVAVADPSVDHRPVADAAGECICFAVTDGPLRLTGPIGRVVERFFPLKGVTVAWITGASSGIGRAVALELARNGVAVAATARRADELGSLAAEAATSGGRIVPFAGDVSDADAMARIAGEIAAALGAIDLAILNAGLFIPSRRIPSTSAHSRRPSTSTSAGPSAASAPCCLR